MFWSRKKTQPAREVNTSATEIREFFNRAASDEEHFPSSIDPRIYHVKLVLEYLVIRVVH